jgi:hypothetical protein
MVQEQVKVDESQAMFLSQFQLYGFKDKDELVNEALNRLQKDLEKKSLQESAELYAEIYEEDAELRELTEFALSEFPE